MVKKEKTICVKNCKNCPFIILDKEIDMSICSVDTTERIMFNRELDKKPQWCKLNRYNLNIISK